MSKTTRHKPAAWAAPQPPERRAVDIVTCPWCGAPSTWQSTRQIHPELPAEGETTEEHVAALANGDRLILDLVCAGGHGWQIAFAQQPGLPAMQMIGDASGRVVDMAELEQAQQARQRTAALSRILLPPGVLPS